ncbi:MAG: hypothetical protein ABEJ31_08980 [Haloarculaceae archaeon]
MAEITVGDRTLDVEVVAAGEAEQYYLAVTFRDRDGDRRTAECELDVEGRSDLTTDRLEAVLTDWRRDRDDVAAVEGFVVRAVAVARRGAAADAPTRPGATAGLSRVPAGRDRVPYAPGERVVYHVDGPDSDIYGYTTEAVVTAVPPIHKQHREPIRGKVEIDTGADSRLIPTGWIVGPADAADVAVDRPNEDL